MPARREIRGELPIVQSLDEKSQKSKAKSKRGALRALVLIAVHLIIALHISHYYLTGRSVSPVEPSESMYALELGHLNAGTIFFGLAILGTAVFGRFFCGWACHIIALQDLCSYLLRKVGIRPKPLRSRLLALVPFLLAFYMFFWPTVQRLWLGMPHPGFSNHLLTDNFWKTFPNLSVSLLTFAVCGGLIVYLLGNKGFCTYACPYGAFFTVSDLVAVGKIRVTDACQHCGQCTAACTSNVFVSREVKEFGMVVDPGCMKCLDCVSACPNDALYYGFVQQSPIPEPRKSTRKSYDFSWPEEIGGLLLTGVTVYALRGLYDTVPFLLAVALGVITAYLFIQFIRVFQRRDLRLQRFQLKRGGKITSIGYACLGLLIAWFIFNAHSFVVQHHRYRGRQHLSQINVALDELFMIGPREFSDEEKGRIAAATNCFEISDRIGLADVYEVKFGLAITSMMQSKVDQADKYLREAYQFNPAMIRDLLVEFLGAQGRQEEAREFFENRT